MSIKHLLIGIISLASINTSAVALAVCDNIAFAEFGGGRAVAEAVEQQFGAAVIEIIQTDKKNEAGTAFFISHDGYALTATHVASHDGIIADSVKGRSQLWPGKEVKFNKVGSTSFAEGDVTLLKLADSEGTIPLNAPVFQVYLPSTYPNRPDLYVLGFTALGGSKKSLKSSLAGVTDILPVDGNMGHVEIIVGGPLGSGMSGGPLVTSRGVVWGLAHDKEVTGAIGSYSGLSSSKIVDMLLSKAVSSKTENLLDQIKSEPVENNSLNQAVSAYAPYWSNFELLALKKELELAIGEEFKDARTCLTNALIARIGFRTEFLSMINLENNRNLALEFSSQASNLAKSEFSGVYDTGAASLLQASEELLRADIANSLQVNEGWKARLACSFDTDAIPAIEGELLSSTGQKLADAIWSSESQRCSTTSSYQYLASRMYDYERVKTALRQYVPETVSASNLQAQFRESEVILNAANALSSNVATKSLTLDLLGTKYQQSDQPETAVVAYREMMAINAETPDFENRYEWVNDNFQYALEEAKALPNQDLLQAITNDDETALKALIADKHDPPLMLLYQDNDQVPKF